VHHSKFWPPMTGSGQERRIGAVRNISALPPLADVGADIVEPPLCADFVAEVAEEETAVGAELEAYPATRP
jgi:hypothetical protein